MCHARVQQTANEPLRALRLRDFVARDQSIDQPATGIGEPQDPQRRSPNEHRPAIDPSHLRIEHDPPIGGQPSSAPTRPPQLRAVPLYAH
jgi:hypothetical protein